MLNRAQRLKDSGVMMEAISVYRDYLRLVPDDNDARIALVEIYLNLKQNDKAMPHIQLLRQKIPNDPRVQKFANISSRYQGQQRRERISEFEQSASKPDASPKTLLDYARYLSTNGFYSKSIYTYKKYLQKSPNDDNARLEMAKLYAWSKNYEPCTKEINTLLGKNPQNIPARILLGDILLWQDREKRALEAYQYVLKISPGNRTAQNKIDRITSTPFYKIRKLLEDLANDPNGPLLNELAKHYLGDERDYEADSLVQRRLAAAPDDSIALNLADEIEERMQKRFQEQIAKYEELLNRNSKDGTARLAVARFYASVPDLMTAIEHYNSYLEYSPLDYLVRAERAQVYSWAGNYSDAIEEFRKVSIALPEHRQSKLGLAEALIMNDESLAEAEQIFYADWREHPDDVRSKLGYADALRKQGKYPEARKLYKEVLDADSLNNAAQQGLIYLDQDFTPLIRRLEALLKINPDDNANRRRLAGLYFDAKRYYEAEQLTIKLLEVEPDDKRLQAFLAQIQEEKRIYQNEELQRAKIKVQKDPGDLNARIAYAELLVNNQKTEEGLAQYRLIMEQVPDDQEIAVRFAELLGYNKNLEGSSQIYSRLADENPANFNYRFRYAQLLSWMGNNDKALIEYERALRLEPESVECQLGMANALLWKGDLYAAHHAYTRILAKHPRNAEAREAIRNLNGPLFRGIELTTRTGWDSEYFLHRETYLGAIGNFTLKMQARAGIGTVTLEQRDRSHRYLFAEKGWFAFGKLDYQFDKLTRMAAEYRLHVFQEVEGGAFWLEVEHDFKDVLELIGLVGRLRYSSQFAVLDVASTNSLETWRQDLMSEKITAWGKYETDRPYYVEGEFAYISISDGIKRSDIWLNGGYRLKEYLFGGARYENISATEFNDAYWTPDEYQTVSGWLQMSNNFTRWSYSLYGSLGRVLVTNDNIRRFSGTISFRVSKRISLNMAYLALQTTRKDGAYWYRGASGSLLLNL